MSYVLKSQNLENTDTHIKCLLVYFTEDEADDGFQYGIFLKGDEDIAYGTELMSCTDVETAVEAFRATVKGKLNEARTLTVKDFLGLVNTAFKV